MDWKKEAMIHIEMEIERKIGSGMEKRDAVYAVKGCHVSLQFQSTRPHGASRPLLDIQQSSILISRRASPCRERPPL